MTDYVSLKASSKKPVNDSSEKHVNASSEDGVDKNCLRATSIICSMMSPFPEGDSRRSPADILERRRLVKHMMQYPEYLAMIAYVDAPTAKSRYNDATYAAAKNKYLLDMCIIYLLSGN